MKQTLRWLGFTMLAAILVGTGYIRLDAQTPQRQQGPWWTPDLFKGTGTELKSRLGDIELVGNWIYDDLAEGYRQAEQTGKPLMVVFRCVT